MFFTYLVEHRAADQDAAGLGQRLQPRSDVDALAEQVAAVDHHVAEIEPDAELHPPVGGQLPVALLQLALDLDRALHRLDDAGELRQQAVAGGVDHAPVVAGDEAGHGVPVLAQRGQGRRLVGFHQPAVAGDVGAEDRGQLALHGFGHGRSPLRCRPGNAGRPRRPALAKSTGQGRMMVLSALAWPRKSRS
jgi:hypothetical protein